MADCPTCDGAGSFSAFVDWREGGRLVGEPAHLADEATVERVARAWCWAECHDRSDAADRACKTTCAGTWREMMPNVRSALAAAVGGGA